jgi:hypothetical protein
MWSVAVRDLFVLICCCVAILRIPYAQAACTSHSTSTHTFTSCSDGSSSISQTIGNNTYTTSSDGSSGTSFSSGNVTYHTNRHGSGTSYRSGDYIHHHWSDGSTGVSHEQAGVTRHQWREGVVGSEQKLGRAPTTQLDRARELKDLAERRAIYGHIAGQ